MGTQLGNQSASIYNEGPVFNANFGSGSSYGNTATNYPPPTPFPRYDVPQGNHLPKCPPYIPMDYKEPPAVCYPPTHHYQQDYNCYQPTPIHFPTMPQYGYTANPNIPCPPEMAAAPRVPGYPTPMNMPSLPRQITPFGRPEEMQYPPAPNFPDLRPPSPPPTPPTFYCPPTPTPACDYPPIGPQPMRTTNQYSPDGSTYQPTTNYAPPREDGLPPLYANTQQNIPQQSQGQYYV